LLHLVHAGWIGNSRGEPGGKAEANDQHSAYKHTWRRPGDKILRFSKKNALPKSFFPENLSAHRVRAKKQKAGTQHHDGEAGGKGKALADVDTTGEVRCIETHSSLPLDVPSEQILKDPSPAGAPSEDSGRSHGKHSSSEGQEPCSKPAAAEKAGKAEDTNLAPATAKGTRSGQGALDVCNIVCEPPKQYQDGRPFVETLPGALSREQTVPGPKGVTKTRKSPSHDQVTKKSKVPHMSAEVYKLFDFFLESNMTASAGEMHEDAVKNVWDKVVEQQKKVNSGASAGTKYLDALCAAERQSWIKTQFASARKRAGRKEGGGDTEQSTGAASSGDKDRCVKSRHVQMESLPVYAH